MEGGGGRGGERLAGCAVYPLPFAVERNFFFSKAESGHLPMWEGCHLFFFHVCKH